jgi:GTP-binding protein
MSSCAKNGSVSMLKIALVGRPNVGKSAIFNCIVKQSQAIVDEEEGVTRDRMYGRAELFGRKFEAIDTGGMMSDDEYYGEEVTRQAKQAIEEAHAIIHVVDGQVGPQAIDLEVARIIRRAKKPSCLAVNKIDDASKMEKVDLFACLGIRPVVAVSATHRFQIAELLEAVLQQVPEHVEEIVSSHPKIAIVGRPNVGKSLLYNSMLGQMRTIVSPVAGTTRDSIDSDVEVGSTIYTMIDTAGIRRKHKERATVEKFAAIRTQRAIERADVCMLVVDCQVGVTSEEKRIARLIEDSKKGCVLVLNKWDLVSNFRMEHALQGLDMEVSFLAHCPKLCVSAKTGRNVVKIFPAIDRVLNSLKARIPTRQINKQLMQWMEAYHPPMIGGRRLRIYYMTQVGIMPPQFVLFVNSAALMEDGYRRYLVNKLRAEFGFEGVPFLLSLRGKASRGERKVSTVDRDLSSVAFVAHDVSDEESEETVN